MKIGIDAHGIGGHSFGLGNETYFKNLIARLLDLDAENQYHVFVNHPEAMEDAVAGHDNVQLISLRPHTQWIQRPVSLPLYAQRHRLDLVHVPFVRPPYLGTRTVVTVHDADYEVHPQDFKTIERWRMKLLVPASCRRADLIFTVSEFTKRQIHDVYGVPNDKIVVTHNAADHLDRPGDDPALPVRTLNLPAPFVFFVGMIQPKKNIPRLVRAFELLKSRTSFPHHLVLAGKWGWRNDELQSTLSKLRFRDHIHFIGYLNPRELETYLPKADMFVFPSLYESFGIPPLEAQRLGVPALVSNTTCFPEIYGDSALYCDPHDVLSIATGMELMLGSAGLRNDLARRGRQNVTRFAWNKTAQIALEGYRRLFQQGSLATTAVSSELRATGRENSCAAP